MPKRFWRGKKRLAKKYVGNRNFNYFFKFGLPKVGDLTHDCDGFNHIISQVDVEMFFPYSYRWPRKDGKWLKGAKFPFVECYYDDTYLDMMSGERKPYKHSVCNCGGLNGLRPPTSRESIEAWVLSWDSSEARQTAEEWGWSEEFSKQIEIIKAGGHIVDEQGLEL